MKDNEEKLREQLLLEAFRKTPRIAQNMLYAAMRTFEGKGAEYANGEDRLANFTEGAKMMGTSTGTVWAIYVWKHICAVFTHVKNGKTLTEPLWTRVMDVIVYFTLYMMIVNQDTAMEPMPPEIESYDPHKHA